MTREEFDKQPMAPFVKLILEWACRKPPRRFQRKEICDALYVPPFEAGEAIRILKHPRVGFSDPTCNGAELLIMGSAPCRKAFGTYEEPVPTVTAEMLQKKKEKRQANG